MIETTNPEIDVNELMERIRREAAKIEMQEHRLASPLTTVRTTLPAVSEVAAPPVIGLSKPTDAKKERLEQALRKAREMIEVSSKIPKFFRGLFRRQGGFNRSVLETLETLAKSNFQLNKRVQELRVVAEQQNHWLRDFARHGQSAAAWMRSAGALLGSVAALNERVERLETHAAEAAEAISENCAGTEKSLRDMLERVEANAEAIRQIKAADLTLLQNAVDGQGEQLRHLQTGLDRQGEHLRHLQTEVDRRTDESHGLRTSFNKQSEHLRNLQVSFDGAGEHLRNLQGTSAHQTQQLAHLQDLMQAHAIARAELEVHVAHFAELRQMLTRLEERQANDAVFIKGELSQHGAWLQRSLGKPNRAAKRPAPVAVPGRLDSFYLSFENRFRGERLDIKNRVRFYLPFLADAKAGVAGRAVLDVGCGRGEWLELLQESGLEASGVDLNRAMVAQCEQRQLRATHQDAVAHLRSLPDASLGAVTGFHIIEHLPLETLIDLLAETRRVLQPGGVAIFESPNCKNLTVGACNFNIDPTHRNPVFPETAQFMLEAHGFAQVHLEYLSPADNTPFERSNHDSEVLTDLLYGPQDFAVIGRIPKAK